MLKPPPPTKKPKTKAEVHEDDKDLHEYAAPGEHIEIPAWKRSGLVMDVKRADYGPAGGRRYLVSHNPSDEKGSWYQLEPHHFHNNDNPDHHKVVAKYLDKELEHAIDKTSDAREKGGTKSDDFMHHGNRVRELRKALADHKNGTSSDSDWKAWGSNKATAEKRMKAAKSGSASAKNVPGALKGSSLPNSYSQYGQVHD